MMYMGKGLVVKESTVILVFLNTALMYFLSLCTIVIMACIRSRAFLNKPERNLKKNLALYA